MSIEANRPMTLAVLGPGGVGGLLAGLMARQGHEVICLASESTCDQLREGGITVRSKRFGDFTAAVGAATILSAPVDACLVAVKATQLETALERVPPSVLGSGLAVPFLNGIEHLGILRDRYGDAVVPGTIRVEATRVRPGEIEQASPFVTVELGLPGQAEPARADSVRAFGEHLAAAGIDVRMRSDEQTMMWGKLSFLAPLALLTTHWAAPAGVIRTSHRADLLTLIDEVVAVAAAEGAPIDAESVVQLFDSIPDTMQSSMQRDAAAGQSIEIEAIGGAVVRAAARVRVQVPLTEKLVADLRQGAKPGQGHAGEATG